MEKSNKNVIALFAKIQKVSNSIKNIEKDMEVGKGNYAYKAVSDFQVTLQVKAAETEHGIVSVPVSQELISSEILKTQTKEGYEKITYVDNIKMTLRIFDLESGESITVESFGKGIDAADKGFGKASTYARKYALLNAYKIATGEDLDAEKSPVTEAPKTLDEKRKAILNHLNTDSKIFAKTLEHFNVSDFEDLTDDNIGKIYQTYKTKKVI